MSTVRLCDRCGAIFAEAGEGTSTGQVTVMVRDPYSGQSRPVQKSQDFCQECTSKSIASEPRAIATVVKSRRYKDDD